jgi:anti-sigma-K factor RskA
MDVKEYIASGTLELYVAGVLPPEEMEEVTRLASRHPEIAVEIRKIGQVMEAYGELHSKKPQPELKAKVLETVFKEAPASGILETVREKPVIVRTIRTSTSPAFKYLAAACVILLLACNILFISKWRDAEGQLESLIAQNYQLAENYTRVMGDYVRISSDYKIAADISFRQVLLKGLPIAPDAAALVYWNEKSKETYINPGNLPSPGTDRQYQLWALVDGKPEDAGVFDVTTVERGLQKLKRVEKAQAFAVTLEPRGGSLSPSPDQMYAMAKL